MLDVSPRWRFDALSRRELNEVADQTTVVVPLGSTEQHAEHLPVRVDAAVVTAIAEGAVARAAETVPVLLAPTLPFGFAHHHLQFGGTISLNARTYAELLTDVASSLARCGFRRLVLLNGHGGNISPMNYVTDRISYEIGLRMHIATLSYWQLTDTQATTDALAEAGIPASVVPGHAGHFETSLMLALAPDLVRTPPETANSDEVTPVGTPDLPRAYVRRPDRWASSGGHSDDARLASADLGRKLFAQIVDLAAEFLIAFHRSSEHEGSTPAVAAR